MAGVLLSGCSETQSTTSPSNETSSDDAETVSSEDDDTTVEGIDAGSPADDSEEVGSLDAGSSEGGRRCMAPAGKGTPTTIAEVVDLINALPRPVDFECFLESLSRPLGIFSTSNVQSAQPAEGKRSPRIFLILDDSFTMSLVPGTSGTLEFGEADEGGTRSVKGEVHFPIAQELKLEDAFVRISFDSASGQSSCGVCHDNEEPSVKYPFPTAFLNTVLVPQPFFAVDVSSVRQEYNGCDADEEPERCAMLRGLFGHGDVVQKAFP